jgi:hypothetical protein
MYAYASESSLLPAVSSSSSDTIDVSDLFGVPIPNCIYVPQLPENLPSIAPHLFIHLKVGLLNVAYSSGNSNGGHVAGNSGMLNPPMHQPLTLPLSIHIHPDLLTREQLMGG